MSIARERISDNLNVATVEGFTEFTYCNGTVSYSASPRTTQNGSYRTCTDYVTPGFSRKKAAGLIINNPVSMVKTVYTDSTSGECVATMTGTCTTGQIKKCRYGPLNPPGFDIGENISSAFYNDLFNAKLLAGTSALAGVEEPEWQGIVEFAEANKTAKLLPGMVTDAVKTLRKIKRSRSFRKSGKELWEYVSGTYLAARYGITPVLYSLQGLTNAMASGWSTRKTSRGSASTQVYDEESTVTGGGPGTYVDQVWLRKRTESARVSAGVLYEQRVDFSAHGMELRELPSAAWELIPGSFMADWFLNIGDFIRASTPKVGTRIITSWTTTRHTIESTAEFTETARTLAGWSISTGRTGSSTAKRTKYLRASSIAVGLASKTRDIKFEKPRDFLHAADAIAIFSRELFGK